MKIKNKIRGFTPCSSDFCILRTFSKIKPIVITQNGKDMAYFNEEQRANDYFNGIISCYDIAFSDGYALAKKK
jgi:hypothetical protein